PTLGAIEIVTTAATAASTVQAAAIAAALERFLHDTAPALAAVRESAAPWGRTALAEGVGLGGPNPWGDPLPWGP
ncbi:MAG: hypothetical protein ACRDIL_13990, partial [Candidatus Limnocylindrales bacterium]